MYGACVVYVCAPRERACRRTCACVRAPAAEELIERPSNGWDLEELHDADVGLGTSIRNAPKALRSRIYARVIDARRESMIALSEKTLRALKRAPKLYLYAHTVDTNIMIV